MLVWHRCALILGGLGLCCVIILYSPSCSMMHVACYYAWLSSGDSTVDQNAVDMAVGRWHPVGPDFGGCFCSASRKLVILLCNKQC